MSTYWGARHTHDIRSAPAVASLLRASTADATAMDTTVRNKPMPMRCFSVSTRCRPVTLLSRGSMYES